MFIKLIAPAVLALGTLLAPLLYWNFAPRPSTASTKPSNALIAALSSPGKVVLAGGTFIDEMGVEVVRLAGGPKARVVLIPTAYGPTEEEGIEQFREQWSKWEPASIEILHTRDRTVADDPQFVEPLKTATAVWFYGGVQSRLTDTYSGTLLAQEVQAVFERGGVVGGNCAGAMALGETMIVCGDGEDEDEVILRPGLGIVRKMIADSHYLERNRIERLRSVVEAHPDHFGLGIDSATAVVIDGGELRCIGKSYATTIIPVGEPQGVRFDVWGQGDRIGLADLFAAKPE